MTPEQIVEMIGNVANRADLKAIQANQVFYIKQLLREARAEGMEAAAKIADELHDWRCQYDGDVAEAIRKAASGESNERG
jgi:hypothetical protein